MPQRLLSVALGAVGLLATLAATPLRADIKSATAAYDRGDRAAAYREFLSLAKLGNALAQYNAGVMLVNGEGMPRDVRGGYAWLLCAQDHGNQDAGPLVQQIAKQVKPEVTEKARECLRTYGKDTVRAGLMPRVPEPLDATKQQRPVQSGTADVVFPDAAIELGKMGWVDVEYTVGADGRVKDIWLLEAVPGNLFAGSVIDSLRDRSFEPARVDGQAVAVMMGKRWRFGFRGMDARDLDRINPYLQALGKRADAGEMLAAYTLYRIASGFSELAKRIDGTARGRAALNAGFGPALFLGGYCVLHGNSSCLAGSTEEGLDWVYTVAQAGQVQAQVALGRLALAEGSEEGILRAQRWLEPAALSGDSFAVKYYAAALVGSADPARRDARRARELIRPLLQQSLFVNDPAVWQLAAAAYAGAADFPEAVKAQRTALQRARRFGWDLAPLERNLKAYESNTLASGEFLTLSSTYASSKDDPDRGRACYETPRTGTKLTRCF